MVALICKPWKIVHHQPKAHHFKLARLVFDITPKIVREQIIIIVKLLNVPTSTIISRFKKIGTLCQLSTT
jgi:hypothetical protein